MCSQVGTTNKTTEEQGWVAPGVDEGGSGDLQAKPPYQEEEVTYDYNRVKQVHDFMLFVIGDYIF